MCDKIKSTLIRFLDNNLELYNMVKNETSSFSITPLTRLQLILMYLKLNKEELKKIDIENKEKIIELIQNNNFVLDDLTIIQDEIEYQINELNEIADKLYNYQQSKKIKKINFEKTHENTSHSKSAKLIEYRPKYRDMNPKIHFYRGFLLTRDNIGIYNQMRSHTKTVFNNLLMHFINAENGTITFDESKLLYFIIEIFILNYVENYIEIPYEEVNLPKKEIAEMLFISSNEHIKELEIKFEQKSQKIDILTQRKNVFEKRLPTHAYRFVPKINEELKTLSLEQFEIGIEIQELRKDPKIYNKQFLSVINKSLNSWDIRIINYKDRIRLEFLTFNNCLLENDIEIYVDGLIRLIHMEQLKSFIESPKLKLKNRSI